MALDLSALRPSKTLFVGAALGMTLMVAGAAIRRNGHARCPIGSGRARTRAGSPKALRETPTSR